MSTFAIRNGRYADVAQRPEQLICNQLAGGSNPSIGSEGLKRGQKRGDRGVGEKGTEAFCEKWRVSVDADLDGRGLEHIREDTRVAKWGRL